LEGRERRGRSSLEEEKDPIFTRAAAVVELDGDGGDILILETPGAVFSTKRTSPLQLAQGRGPRRCPTAPPGIPAPPGSTLSLLVPIASRTPPGLGLTPQVTELLGE